MASALTKDDQLPATLPPTETSSRIADSNSTEFHSLGSATSQLTSLAEEPPLYYVGLPSRPRMVGSSNPAQWKVLTGSEQHDKPKVLRPVGNHSITAIWVDSLAFQVVEHLDSKLVAWTSIDVVRVGYEDQAIRPVVLWIGVQPRSLRYEDGTTLAYSTLKILTQSEITDVDVEIRESEVNLLRGPKLLEPVHSLHAALDYQTNFTATLSLPISLKENPSIEGTGGLYMAENGKSKKLFLITARHVVFDPKKNNEHYEYKKHAPHVEIILLGDTAFQKILESIDKDISDRKDITIPRMHRIIAAAQFDIDAGAEGEAREGAVEAHEAHTHELARMERTIQPLEAFRDKISKGWSAREDRLLGHIVYSPPIKLKAGKFGCTQDIAVLEVDPSKVNPTCYKGNVVDIGIKFERAKLCEMMCSTYNDTGSFKHPDNRLLPLRDTIPQDEMLSPPTSDRNNETCLIVLKHGSATGLTVGRANNISSCVRTYFEADTTGAAGAGVARPYSMEWPILPFEKVPHFSKAGDSGAVVVDGGGRIGGIITAGAGLQLEIDITYATSIHSIKESLQTKFPDMHFNPVVSA